MRTFFLRCLLVQARSNRCSHAKIFPIRTLLSFWKISLVQIRPYTDSIANILSRYAWSTLTQRVSILKLSFVWTETRHLPNSSLAGFDLLLCYSGRPQTTIWPVTLQCWHVTWLSKYLLQIRRISEQVIKGARSDHFKFFSNFQRFWYQKKACIFLITPCEFYGWKM